jgi:hypothetical protein
MFKKLGLLALCGASAFAMHSIELNINDTDLEIGARLDMAQFNNTTEPDSVFIGAKLLHADEKNSDINGSDNMHDYYEVSFLMKRKVEATDLVIGLGVKFNGTENYNTIPLGAEASYKLPFSSAIPLYLNGSLYYAPEVLSLQDAKSFTEIRIGLDVELIKNGNVIVGYRSIDTNYEAGKGGDISYNRSLYAGFKFLF